MCKIESETKNNEKKQGSGFFRKPNNFPIKFALFANNHILNELNIEIGNKIKFECLEYQKTYFFNSSYNLIKKEILITGKRRVYTNKELDYTCIELFESDGIKDFFEIDPKIDKYDNDDLKNNDIFILQFPKCNEISFSNGIIKILQNKIIIHTASTEGGSSGSPIIRRSDDNYIIGLHFGGKKKQDKYSFNLAINFASILDNIKENMNEIYGEYKVDKSENEIILMHDYNEDKNWNEDLKKLYMEAKNINKNIFEENIELFINGKKMKFDYIYKNIESKEINVKFKFKKKIENTSFMFYNCKYLKSIDLSSFNTSNVKKMYSMFSGCSSLNSIDFSSYNNTFNVNNMCSMFSGCSSLKSIDLSSFNTSNVENMSAMFDNCSDLKSINLTSFNTCNVKYVNHMFSRCSSLKSIDLSSFNTRNVKNMNAMFFDCPSLKSIDLSSFNTSNVKNMNAIFSFCSSLSKNNIKIKKKDDPILKWFE